MEECRFGGDTKSNEEENNWSDTSHTERESPNDSQVVIPEDPKHDERNKGSDDKAPVDGCDDAESVNIFISKEGGGERESDDGGRKRRAKKKKPLVQISQF